jgi:hypothetical protein
MMEGKIPVLRGDAGEPTSLLPRLKFAYHLDNAPFVAFLARVQGGSSRSFSRR